MKVTVEAAMGAVVALLLLLGAVTADADVVVPARRADKAPRIDGLLDEAVWAGEGHGGFSLYMQPKTPAPVDSRVWAAYDDEALYVAVRCAEPEMKDLSADYSRAKNLEDRRRNSDEEGSAYGADCLEFFLVPDGVGNDATFQFVVNPNGALFDLLISEGGSIKVEAWNARAAEAGGHKGKDFWSVELKIPFGELMLNDRVNASSWKLNVIRNRRRDGKLKIFSFVPLTKGFTDPNPMARLKDVNTNFDRFRWEILPPEIRSVSRVGEALEFVLQIRVVNRTDRFRVFELHGDLTDGGGNVQSAQDKFGLDTGQSGSFRLPVRCIKEGIGSLTLTVRDFNTKKMLSAAWFSMKLKYDALALHFSPHYKNGIFASNPKDRFHVWFSTVLPQAEWQGGTLTVTLKNSEGRQLATQPRTLAKPEDLALRMPFKVKGLPYGRYAVEAVLENGGKRLTMTEAPYHLYPPNKGSEIVIDEHNRFLVNGKPRMLIGLCGLEKETIQFGGTAMITHGWMQDWMKGTRDFITRCAENNVVLAGQPFSHPYNLVRRNPRLALPLNEAEREQIRKDIRNLMHHPAVFGYYIVDEPLPSGLSTERFRGICETIQEVDPYHVTFYSDNTTMSLERYSPYADLPNLHKYPCPVKGGTFKGDPMTLVAYDRKIKSVTGGRKPVGEFIQIFDYGLDMGGVTTAHINDRHPNYAELRFLTLLRAALGGRIFQYYGVAHFHWFPSNRIGIPAIFKEMLSLEEWIVATEEPPVEAIPLGKSAPKPIISLARKTGNGITIFAVNMNYKKLKGKLTCKALGQAKQIQVYSENRTLPVRDGAFEDTFAPYDAHVYSTAIRKSPVLVSEVAVRIKAEKDRLLNGPNLAYVGKGTRATSSSVGRVSFYEFTLHNGYHDESRAWQAAKKELPVWTQLEFPKEETVSEVRLYAKAVRAFLVEAWKDGAWRSLKAVEAKTADPAVCKVGPTRTKKIRITITKADDNWARVEEVEVY